MFPFGELKSATRNFSHQMRLGAGEFGEVFKGWLKIPSLSALDVISAIAVKRLYRYHVQHHPKLTLETFTLNYNDIQKVLDLHILKQFRNPNLVKLLGYCFENEILFFVYEFMENGSLDSHLFTKDKIPLPLKRRVKIAVEVGRGLAFLHRSEHEFAQHQLRLHNILLDKAFNAKLSDFEVEKVVHGGLLLKKTIDPLYYWPRSALCDSKDDVYSFGEVLIQMLTGFQITEYTGWGIVGQAVNLRAGLLKKSLSELDPQLLDLDDTAVEHAATVASVAYNCLVSYEYFSMREALGILEPLYADMNDESLMRVCSQ